MALTISFWNGILPEWSKGADLRSARRSSAWVQTPQVPCYAPTSRILAACVSTVRSNVALLFAFSSNYPIHGHSLFSPGILPRLLRHISVISAAPIPAANPIALIPDSTFYSSIASSCFHTQLNSNVFRRVHVIVVRHLPGHALVHSV